MTKLDNNGVLQWPKSWGSGGYEWTITFGGTDQWGPDSAYGITIDVNGDLVITGGFYSIADFDPGPDIKRLL